MQSYVRLKKNNSIIFMYRGLFGQLVYLLWLHKVCANLFPVPGNALKWLFQIN